MKKLSFILLVAMFLASCDTSISPETSKAFVGEYWMETSTIMMKGDKVVNDAFSPKSRNIDVSKYRNIDISRKER